MSELMPPAVLEAQAPPRTSAHRLLTPLFALAALLGAGLLFVVQPMVARLVLPSYGGSATVWSTSSLFFQVLLLTGYIYAHWSTQRLGRRWQPRVHLLVLVLPLVLLPVALPLDAEPGADVSPALWLLRTLALMIGLPFVVVSTTGPLLQRWYSWTDAPRAEDPYFLFAASNLGSFGGLLCYPFLVEPTLTLDQQRHWWSIGFVVWVVLTAACGLGAARSRRVPRPVTDRDEVTSDPLTRRRVGRWLWWSFLPSALMLAVTAHITTDVAAMPLLWVVPLAIYLATFVVAFARTSRTVPVTATRCAVTAVMLASAAAVVPALGVSILWEIGIGLTMLALVAFAAHARLAVDRPAPEHLTAFYIVIAVGGALGGVLNGLVAPIVFDRVLEYPLVLVGIPLLMLGLDDRPTWLDRLATRQVAGPALLIGLAAAGGGVVAWAIRQGVPIPLPAVLCLGLVIGVLGFRIATQPRVFTVLLAMLLGLPLLVNQLQSLDQSRTFFGSYRVLERDQQKVLVHGRTIHGSQFMDTRSDEPTTYYSRGGPLGSVFGTQSLSDVAAVGLGVGTIAAYGQPGTRFTFIEIDPEVVRIAEEDFSYLSDTEAEVTTLVGDGRLRMAEQPPESFDAVLLDAFSSDSIPVHLLTVEAMREYAEALRPGGLLVVHISNHVFDLEPVLVGAAQELGLEGAVGLGGSGPGARPSQWVVLTQSAAAAHELAAQEGWRPLSGAPVTWTDHFSSVLDVLR